MRDPTPLSSRARTIEPFHAVEIYREALMLARTRPITVLCIGEPDFPTPPAVVDAAVAAARRGETHYTMPIGIPELRTAIAGHYREQYRVAVESSRVAVTVGASGALALVFGALADPGDEVLMADPGYPANRAFLAWCGAESRLIPVGPAERFQLTAELVRAHWGPRTIGVMVASPANPTGTCLADEGLRAIHAEVMGRGGSLIVDEIYHGLTFGVAPMTAASLGGKVFVVNSFSKYYGMTGWRVGWMVAPAEYMEVIERLQGQIFLCPPAPSQWAAVEAMGPASRVTYEQQRTEFHRRRDYLVPALRSIGLESACVPDGAFYVYANVRGFSTDSWTFCSDLLHEAGVALTPGRDFGRHRAEEHVRVSYTLPIPRLEEAVWQMGRFSRRRGVA